MSGTGDQNNEGLENQNNGAGDGAKPPEGQKPGAEDKGGDDKGPKTLEEALALVGELRKENAKHRTSNKELNSKLAAFDGSLKKVKESLGIKDEEEAPEAKITNLQGENEALQVKLSMMQIARENNIPVDQDDYFQFLLAKEFEGLEEGAELPDEALQSVIGKVQAVSGKKGANSTGVNSKTPNEGQKSTGVTVEQFVAMDLMGRSELYQKDPNLYSDLMGKARAKNLI